MIDYNQFSKTMSTLLGLFFILLGLASFGFAGFIYTKDVKTPDSTLHMQETLTECLDIAKSKSAYTGNLDLKNKEIKIQKYGLVDGKTELMETINVIERCNDVVIKEFCVGLMDTQNKQHGCDITGVQVVLQYKEPWST